MSEKRILRGYKATDKAYGKAMKRAKKEKGYLANLIENVVANYGEGYNIVRTDGNGDSVLLTATPAQN